MDYILLLFLLATLLILEVVHQNTVQLRAMIFWMNSENARDTNGSIILNEERKAAEADFEKAIWKSMYRRFMETFVDQDELQPLNIIEAQIREAELIIFIQFIFRLILEFLALLALLLMQPFFGIGGVRFLLG